jgi:hypothetical protein
MKERLASLIHKPAAIFRQRFDDEELKVPGSNFDQQLIFRPIRLS